MFKLAPSILAADFTVLGQQLAEVHEAGASYIHVDVMDGLFVPAISFGMPVISSIRKATNKPFDVHLMIMEPERYLEEFKKCGADLITFHLEAVSDPRALIDEIHSLELRAGISIRPDTPVEKVLPYLELVDMVLVMSVYPGFGGQEFIGESLERIGQISNFIKKNGLSADIEVDGGLHHGNVAHVIEAGANIIVAGSAVFNGNIKRNIEKFQDIFDQFLNPTRLDWKNG